MRLSCDMSPTEQELRAQGAELRWCIRQCDKEQMRLWREWRPPDFRCPKAGGVLYASYVHYFGIPGIRGWWTLDEHLCQFAVDQRRFRKELKRQRGFFVPGDLIFPTKQGSTWDGFLGHLSGGTTVESALDWAEWVSRGAPRCVRFWRGAFDRWCERGCARHGATSPPVGTVALKGRWRECKWEEPPSRVQSHVSIHDAVNRAAQRIQRFFLMARAKLMVATLRGEPIRPATQKDPVVMAFSLAVQAVTADYQWRAADACVLYEQAVSAFSEVEREFAVACGLIPGRICGGHQTCVAYAMYQQSTGYLQSFSRRVKELQPVVDAVHAVEQAIRERRDWDVRYREHQEAMSAREEQRRLRRAARKDQKRLRYRVARPAREERQRVRQEQLTAELAGEWLVSGRGEAPDGRVFLRDLDVYGPSDDSPFLWFVKVDSEGFLVYVYGDGERVLARFDGGILTWDDGDVYQRVCDAKVEQVQEVTGSMDIDDATGVDDDVDDILGGARAVFLGGAYDWHVEDDDFSEAHHGHASMARQLMSGGYIAGNCGTREWLYHHYEYIKGDGVTASLSGAAD